MAPFVDAIAIKTGLLIRYARWMKSTGICELTSGPAKAYFHTGSPKEFAHFFGHGYKNDMANERKMISYIVEYVDQDTVFYDIGAHLGKYATLIASVIEQGEVVAFEAQPEYIGKAMANASLNELDIVFRHTLVGEDSGPKEIGRLSYKPDLVTGTVSVPQTTIDAEVANGLSPPDVIKLDVDGDETSVIKGMENTIQVHSPTIFIELHVLEGDDPQDTESWDLLQQHGYSIEFIHRRKGDVHLLASIKP